MSMNKALPKPGKTTITQEQRIAELKIKFIEYFKQLPVQKLAAASIGRDEDTISSWKATDADFSDHVEQAKAEWALKNVKEVKSREWLLERLMKDHFSPRQEYTGKEGGPIQLSALTDDQLEQLIDAKIRQTRTGAALTGETTPDAGEPT